MTSQTSSDSAYKGADSNLFWFSIISGTLAVVFGLILSLFILYMTIFAGTQTEKLAYLATQQATSQPFSSKVEDANKIINQNELFANLSVFVFWSLAGLALYSICSVLLFGLQAIRGAAVGVWFSPKSERASIVEEMLARTGVRVVGIFGLYALYKAVLVASPYVLVWVVNIRENPTLFSLIAICISMFMAGVLAIYLATLFLRLVTLRTRVFF